ncbi:hypothetical protein HCG69_10315 [Bacteroides sp. K03]|uniref:hypothetical protein n=1 Tax=Bacteroides sp. K03 TaxID=2718928 RepID=UPI001C8BEF5F|nr:hypothetical protein [Bacteroides sp. K03]MBX9188463.1 hypothetical protein [Bacteroides sp. K03]
MKTRFFVTCVCVLMSFCVCAQKEYNDKVNKRNNKGQKEGYWIEDRGFDTIELYYQNGRKSGVFKSYSKKGTLDAFGEYTDGRKSGTWYYFGDRGHLEMIQKDFKINTDTVSLDNNARYIYPYKCYTITYYPNGIVQNEGILLWDEDSELDTVREYGEWKYYDESGKLIRTKVF